MPSYNFEETSETVYAGWMLQCKLSTHYSASVDRPLATAFVVLLLLLNRVESPPHTMSSFLWLRTVTEDSIVNGLIFF